MGMREPFLHKLVEAVVDQMKEPYPDLTETTDRVASVIKSEEANFFSTIDTGLEKINRVFADMKTRKRSEVDGAVAFGLYQESGVPAELFEALAAEQGYSFNWPEYEEARKEHIERTGRKKHGVMGNVGAMDELKSSVAQTEFVGYDTTSEVGVVQGIILGEGKDEELLEEATESEQELRVILDRTPFYGESGGQVGDSGKLVSDSAEFSVTKTLKDGSLFVHVGTVTKGTLKSGDKVTAEVDTDRRDGIRRAHSATHILHWALQNRLGSHAQQQGSKVDDDWLRFDFTNLEPVGAENLQTIEKDVRGCVAAKDPIKCETLPLADARAAGAMMLFGEKYPDPVRMVSMGEFSKELCGGTHLTNTEQVDQFEIIGEEGASAGTRRVTALTGKRAKEHRELTLTALKDSAKLLKVDPAQVPEAMQGLTDRATLVEKGFEWRRR